MSTCYRRRTATQELLLATYCLLACILALLTRGSLAFLAPPRTDIKCLRHECIFDVGKICGIYKPNSREAKLLEFSNTLCLNINSKSCEGQIKFCHDGPCRGISSLYMCIG